MSYVSSYLFVSYYNDEAVLEIRKKLSEIVPRYYWCRSDEPTGLFPLKDPELNETGGKGCQFGDMFFCGLNFFNDEVFQKWILSKKFKDIQVFFCSEHDDGLHQIYPENIINNKGELK